MASLIKKKKGNRLYYYLVESARVDGQPRIVHQAYLGTAEKLAELVQQKSAPVPLSATLRDFGLPGALWLAAKQSGLWPLLESLWPAPRSGPGPAHYLLLAAIHRICDPGPKTEVSDWYDRTILASEWGFPDRKSTRLNSSHRCISYAVFCLKKKNLMLLDEMAEHQRRARCRLKSGHVHVSDYLG